MNLNKSVQYKNIKHISIHMQNNSFFYIRSWIVEIRHKIRYFYRFFRRFNIMSPQKYSFFIIWFILETIAADDEKVRQNPKFAKFTKMIMPLIFILQMACIKR